MAPFTIWISKNIIRDSAETYRNRSTSIRREFVVGNIKSVFDITCNKYGPLYVSPTRCCKIPVLELCKFLHYDLRRSTAIGNLETFPESFEIP